MCSIKIGWASTDITPIGAIGDRVALIGNFRERITGTVHDPIQATVLVIEATNGQCAALVSLDLALATDHMIALTRQKLAEKVPGFPLNSLVLAATHVHTAPNIRLPGETYLGDGFFDWGKDNPEVITTEAYLDFLTERVASAIDESWRSRAPGGLAFRVGRIAVPHCRRVCYKDGSTAMYGNTGTPEFLRIEGQADNGAEIVVAYNAENRLTGVLVNLACPAQVIEGNDFISADLWGSVRRQWSECPFVLPLCGAAGDITMRDLVRRDRMEPSTRSFEGMDELAGRIVRELKYVISTIKPEDVQADLLVEHITRGIMLPIKTVTKAHYREARQTLADSSKDALTYDRFLAAGSVKRYQLQAQTTEVEMELHALRLGKAVLVTNSFELYQDYGMQIKARSPAVQTIITQLSGGHMGYLPTEVAVSGGGYSASVVSGYCGPEGGDALVEKTLAVISELFH